MPVQVVCIKIFIARWNVGILIVIKSGKLLETTRVEECAEKKSLQSGGIDRD
jgi:hypothetical protein